MAFIKPVTGVNITTRVSMESADLGVMRWDDQRNAIAAMWGDNFTNWRMQGEWQSPSLTMHDKDLNLLGIPTKTGIAPNGARRQLWPYPHNNPDYSTILPCDFIRIGDWWHVAAMVTAGLGNEKRTIFWRSRDLIDWEKTDPYVSLVHRDQTMNFVGHPGNVMLTFDQIDDWVYIYGTNGLARDRSIWLWRNRADEFPNGLWEPWGMDHVSWAWGNPNERTPILVGQFGELCFRYIQGNCVLSFFDAQHYRQTALTVVNPTDDWTRANRVDYAHGSQFPQLYGGYIAPGSRLNELSGMKFLVSQWNTANNDPYHVCQFNDTLHAMGPLLPEKPKPRPEPKPEPKPEPPPEEKPVTDPVPTTPQETFDLLLHELSASGSTLITTPEGDHLTLREAVERIHWKECALHSLQTGEQGARPRHPKKEDDQLGHTLNARAEGLFTQAVVVAIADRFDIDTQALYDQVKESYDH